MNDINILRNATALLAGTPLGECFMTDIERLANHPEGLHLSLLLSVTPPEGLDDTLSAKIRVDASASEQSMSEMAQMTDVIFWVMPALRMFHGDFLPALDAALSSRVPIWIGLTGVDAVSDPAVFVQAAIADAKARLGVETEIFIFRKEHLPSELLKLRDALACKAPALAATGKARRYQALRASMLKRLVDLRRSVEADFAALERRLETAAHGLEAARIQLKSAIGQFQDIRGRLTALLDTWAQTMCARIESANDSRKVETVCQSIEKALESFLEQTFSPAVAEAGTQVMSMAESAWQDLQNNIQRFLAPVYRSAESTDSTLENLKIEFPTVRMATFVEAYKGDVHNAASHLKSMFSGDWWLAALRTFGTPLVKKRRNAGPLVAIESMRKRAERESAITNLRAAATRASEDLRRIHMEFQNRLNLLLDEIADEKVASIMNQANHMLEQPTELRRSTLKACEILESDEKQSR